MRITRLDWSSDIVALADRVIATSSPLAEVRDAVGEIIAKVRRGGDFALDELSIKFEGRAPASLRVDPAAIKSAWAALEPELQEAFEVAATNIRAVAAMQRPEPSPSVTLPQGHTVTITSSPVAAAGIYAPGGQGAYPSSVLMCAIPAQVAGVQRIALASPQRDDGLPSSLVLAACSRKTSRIGEAFRLTRTAPRDSVTRIGAVAGLQP